MGSPMDDRHEKECKRLARDLDEARSRANRFEAFPRQLVNDIGGCYTDGDIAGTALWLARDAKDLLGGKG